MNPEASKEAPGLIGETFTLTEGAPEQGISTEQAQEAVAALSSEELLLLQRNPDQFRHHINKKAKRLKAEAKAKKISITEKE